MRTMRGFLGRATALAVLGVALNTGCGEDSEHPQAAASGKGGQSGTAGQGGTGARASDSGADAGGASGSSGSGGEADSSAGTSGAGGGDSGDAGGAPGSDASGGTGGWGADGGTQLTSSKLDVLLVIDNSRSMADKQQVLDRSAMTLVSRLTSPRCMSAQGNPVSAVPPNPDQPCPAGSTREIAPVRDMHIGVISSSLGGHGADTCSPTLPSWDPSEDDRGELLTRGGVATYQNRGYLVWDPNRRESPVGETNAATLASKISSLVVGAGEVGCGFEAPLEAWYRFLVDPEPRQSIVVRDSVAVLEGINQTVLTQRSQFLRPDSALLIVVLTDENDCSMAEGGIGWIAGQGGSGAGIFTLPRATSACVASPNSPCCRSCNTIESAPPNGCQPTSADPGCTPPTTHTEANDPLNLRCYEQKRRFGIDFLYPIERYVHALTSPTVPNRAGVQVPNPLFSGGRDPSLITVAGIVGVPWQDLAKDPGDTGTLRYMTAAELRASGRWPMLIGDRTAGTPPLDPFMRESIDPRSGTNPVTGDAIQPPSAASALANPINGHEYMPAFRNDLQYACIFRLLTTRECGSTSGCDCSTIDGQGNKVLCQGPNGAYGTTQYFAKAYPGLRPLELLNQLGERSVVASICPRNLTEIDQDDYAYGPAVQAIIDRLKNVVK